MTWPNRFSTIYEPDGGGTGDPDGGDPDGAGGDLAAKPEVVNLKTVVDGIKEAIAASRQPAVAAAPAVSTPRGPDPSTQAALAAEADRVNQQVNDLIAAGNGAEAMNVRDAFIRKANAAHAADPSDNVIVKTAVQLGERVARTEHKTVMDRWGDEVKRAIDAMPLEERVLPNAWDRAVRDVRANHFEELLSETVEQRVTEERKKFVPPPGAPGSRGQRTLQGAASKLSEEELWGADLCGVSPDEYAKEKAREVQYDSLPFKERAKFPGYPVLDDARGNQRVVAGKF